MKNLMQRGYSSELSAATRTFNVVGFALAILIAAGTLAPLAGCQNAPKATETTRGQADSQDNVMEPADPQKNWVSGIWVRNDAKKDEPSKNLALFASPSGEIALGTLGHYTIAEDGTVKMAFTKSGDGKSPAHTIDMSFSRNAAGDVSAHLTRDGYDDQERPQEITLPLTPRESALVSLDDEQWIVGWWTIPVGNRPYALCFFPDGSCTFTDQYGLYKVDGNMATLQMRHGSQQMRELNLEQNGTVRLSLENKPGVKQRNSGVTFTRKRPDPV